MPPFRSAALAPWIPVVYMGASVNPCTVSRKRAHESMSCQLEKDHSDQHGAKVKMRLGGQELWIYWKED